MAEPEFKGALIVPVTLIAVLLRRYLIRAMVRPAQTR